jgi:hypothetical protein
MLQDTRDTVGLERILEIVNRMGESDEMIKRKQIIFQETQNGVYRESRDHFEK